MQKLWVRITFSFLLLMFFILLGSGFFLAELTKSTYIDLKENQLMQNASLTIRALEIDEASMQTDELQARLSQLADADIPRITIIDRQGEVLADTVENPDGMENHLDRPEFKEVLKDDRSKGLSIRHSDTLGYSMMYVTVPLEEEGVTYGAVRASVTLEDIEAVVFKLWTSLALVLLTALILTAFVGMHLAKGISKPIEEIIRVAKKLNQKDFSARVETGTKGELGQLAEAINHLAANLKHQVEKIRENEQQLTGVMANMMSGVLLVNKQGRIQLVNRALTDMLGSNVDAFNGKLHTEVVKSAGLSILIEKCLKNEKEIKEEIHVYYPEERILDVHLAPYVDERGEMKGIIAVLHDISDIRRLEKMRSEFVANVSHELKTPITSVKGFAETLLDGALEDQELCRSFLTIINDESERLHRLINDILDLSKIEQHRMPLTIEQINLTESIYGTVELVKDEAAKKQIIITLPEKKPVWIQGEQDRIQQIILNLFSNAISYTGEKGEVNVSLEERLDEVELRVADTGIGIAKKELPRIFERFYRVDKARTRASGSTGLGLAIVKHLVDSHHGTIQAESEEGKGTTFIVTLPKQQP